MDDSADFYGIEQLQFVRFNIHKCERLFPRIFGEILAAKFAADGHAVRNAI